MTPKVSVVMSVYNGERYLREALESVLDQTLKHYEFLIVDDGSTDKTWDILTSYDDARVQLYRNPRNIGLTPSLNSALSLARGVYIARQDADDVSLPTRLEQQAAFLDQYPQVGLLGTAYQLIDARGNIKSEGCGPVTDTEIRWRMLFSNAFAHPSVMFRRGLLAHCEGYDQALPYSQDYDLWARMLQYTQGANLRTPLIAYRAHASSVSNVQGQRQENIAVRVSKWQIGQILPTRTFSGLELKTLRTWYHNFPQRLSPQDMGLCRELLHIFAAFAESPQLDPKILFSLRCDLIEKIISSITFQNLWFFIRTGLFYHLIRPSSLKALILVIIKKVGRVVIPSSFQKTLKAMC